MYLIIFPMFVQEISQSALENSGLTAIAKQKLLQLLEKNGVGLKTQKNTDDILLESNKLKDLKLGIKSFDSYFLHEQSNIEKDKALIYLNIGGENYWFDMIYKITRERNKENGFESVSITQITINNIGKKVNKKPKLAFKIGNITAHSGIRETIGEYLIDNILGNTKYNKFYY